MNLYAYSILRRCIHVFWQVVYICSKVGFHKHLDFPLTRFEIGGVTHPTISELSLCKHTHFHLQVYSSQCLNPILHCLLEIQLKLYTKHTSSHFVSKIIVSISSLSAYCDMAIHKCKSKAADFSRFTNIPEILDICDSREQTKTTSLAVVLLKMCSVQQVWECFYDES